MTDPNPIQEAITEPVPAKRVGAHHKPGINAVKGCRCDDCRVARRNASKRRKLASFYRGRELRERVGWGSGQ